MRRILASTLFAASCAALAVPATAASMDGDRPARLLEAEADDSPSIAVFVERLRAQSEKAPAPAHSLQEALSRITPDISGFPRCLTPITLAVTRQGGVPSLASWLAPVLAPPALPRESVLLTQDGHFVVHYTSERASGHGVLAADRDGNGSPDYVDQVVAALGASRRTLLGRLGYRDAENGSPIDVYLANLGGRIDGYFMPASAERASFLVIDSRLLGNDALLRAAVAHQYAHAVLRSYDSGAVPLWWSEACASWLEGMVVGSFAHYAEPLQAAIEHAASGLEQDDARLLPGRLLWPAYLATLGPRGSVVRSIWESLERVGEDAAFWQATDEALRLQGSTLERAFSDYALWVLLSGERSDGQHFSFADRLGGVLFSGNYAAYPSAEIQTAPMLAPFGAAFVKFVADGTEGGMRLSFEGDSPGLFQAQLLLTPRKEGAPLVRAVIAVDPHGHASIGIPWATFSEAVLVVGNVTRGGGQASYSFVASPDRTFPFAMSFFSAEPEEDDVRLTWETESEDGLFGWILYRAERSGGAPRQVNDAIVPAIGDGDGPVSYQYLDHGAFPGRTYYYTLVGVTHEGLTRAVPETRVDVLPPGRPR